MSQYLYQNILILLAKPAPSIGIGIFRFLYGLVTLQEIIFLFYFNHLIFDPIPFIDVEFPGIPLFLCLWGIVACCLTVGYRYQFSALANYLFWLVFVNFTSMQRDFDGGFDTFMIGVGFFLLFMPGDKSFSLDRLRYKLNRPFDQISKSPPITVSALAYHLPVFICLGLLYLDSDIHKFFAEHWRNGLGSWLPATQPFYVSAIDMSPLLNVELLQKAIGYTIMVFQFTFVFFYSHPRFRVLYLLIGSALHLGIIFTLNIYPFGLGMLICYTLLVPFKWWRNIGHWLKLNKPLLTVFYDKECPLCNRTVIILNHFDLFNSIDFKNAQDYAANFPVLSNIAPSTLLTDLYALDNKGQIYSGVETYRQILIKMSYLAPFGLLLGFPGIKHYANKTYRKIADARLRTPCGEQCEIKPTVQDKTFYQQIFEQYGVQKPKACSRKIAKIVLALLFLQVNSTIHYGICYRLPIDFNQFSISKPISQASNALLMVSATFLGITPHALYLHDHFLGYDHMIGIAYLDSDGNEQWLPFVNEQGRLLAPNWGRVHSMWANIAVTRTIDNTRLQKFIMKVTAFWGREIGLNLNDTVFIIKMKKISAPTYWVEDQLHKNFASKWISIGKAQWQNRQFSIQIPSDINSM